MQSLITFAPEGRAVVIGASGGIGSALARRLVEATSIGSVTTLSRRVRPGTGDRPIDIMDEQSIAQAAAEVARSGPLDLVIVATGILHDSDRITPEKRLRDFDADAMTRVFGINAVGPAMVAKHFLPHLRRGSKTVFAALSARVGSIGDNRLGGWASYRASKAALNMLLRTVAIEHARTRPESVVLALHPGTVDTALSKPFQGNVPDEKLFTPDYAADRLLDVIENAGAADSGGFFAWDGTRIEY